jgi:Nif-specific regulatory protein
VKFNCAALPESIIESELFGHEKGAFTGAVAMRKGRFEVAHGGTIFLDEIGDVSPATQVKLLRVLQEREFEHVGGHLPIKADVRILTATSRNLEEMIEQDKFRADLYYRLNVFPIYAPPLRERKSDILLLADYFVEKYSNLNQKSVRRISTAAIDLLLSYHWPGNVRELENCIERSVLLSPGKSIEANHLPPTLQKKDASEKSSAGGTLDTAVAALEYEMIVAELKGCDGNMAAAARKLGLTERQMGLRVKRLGIDFKRFRRGEAAPA